jgi:NAD-dependent deacetylase
MDASQKIDIGPGHSVVFLTGAGISAESGIRTFRDARGLWEEHRVEEVASPEGFAADPALVWRFYAQRRAQALTVAPNAAHRALAELERLLGPDRFFLATQNVDPLHEAGGSKEVVHMHGELFRTRCSEPECPTLPFHDERHDFPTLPRCTCGALQRPHIVWFGEIPFEMHAIKRRVQACDLFVTVGSSGVGLPRRGARARDAVPTTAGRAGAHGLRGSGAAGERQRLRRRRARQGRRGAARALPRRGCLSARWWTTTRRAWRPRSAR